MNILNVVLSGIVSVIISYFTIINMAGKNNINNNFKNIIVYFLILIPFILLTCFSFVGIPKLIINITATIFALYFSIFKKDISNSVYYTITYNLFAATIEILLSLIFVGLLKFDINAYEKFSFSLLLFSVLNCSLVYLISKIKLFTNSIQKFNKIVSQNNRDWIYIIICIILVVLLITFNKYNLKSNVEFNLIKTDKGLQATNVKTVNEKELTTIS